MWVWNYDLVFSAIALDGRFEQREEKAGVDDQAGEQAGACDLGIGEGHEQSGDYAGQSTDRDSPAVSLSPDLLVEMNTLANELSAFASLMVCSIGCSGDYRTESREDEESQKQPARTGNNGANFTVQVASTHDHQIPTPPLASDEQSPPVSEMNTTAAIHPTATQSNHHKAVCTQPSKRTPRRPKRERVRSKEPLHKKVREILSSPTLWKDYQSKSFQQHIKRQQQARQQVEYEHLMAEKAEAAHFKRAKDELRLGSTCSAHPKSQSRKTYSMQFVQDRHPKQVCQQQEQNHHHMHAGDDANDVGDVTASGGLLCGVYLYGNRRLGMVYITCSALPQLKERICLRFTISSVLNLYRERALPSAGRNGKKRHAHNSKALQRITTFDQVRDGDRICATQDAYEDMAILCEWMKRRQSQVYQIQHQESASELEAPVRSPSTVEYSDHKVVKKVPTFASSVVEGGENATLWDANGRNMAVKKQLIV